MRVAWCVCRQCLSLFVCDKCDSWLLARCVPVMIELMGFPLRFLLYVLAVLLTEPLCSIVSTYALELLSLIVLLWITALCVGCIFSLTLWLCFRLGSVKCCVA